MNATGTGLRILVVDDDTAVLTLLGRALRTEEYEIVSSRDGVDAVQAIRNHLPALVILDINLPSLNWFEVCQQVREASQAPIIVVSGRNSDEDKMYAFKLGVDDYVTKPFSPRELVSRVRAVLRRSAPFTVDPVREVLRYSGFEIDLLARRVTCRANEARTTPIEFDLLSVLSLNAGKALTHRMLLT